jgi:hypothetical protein
VNNSVDLSEFIDHPSEGSLLLYLARELPVGQSRKIAAHLGQCWTCVGAVERLKEGIQIFIECRASLSGPIEVPPPAVWTLRQRIESRSRGRSTLARNLQSLRAIVRHSFSRPLQIAVAFSLSVSALVLIVTRPPSLSAAEVLRLAGDRARVENAAGSHWLHRKIRIRSGLRVVDWESYATAGDSGAKRTAESAEWSRILRGPVSWDDPLSVADFSEWRARQHRGQDSISASNDRIVITTSGQPDQGIRSSSLTVRRADWHPIAKSVTTDGKPSVEITELIWEVRDTAGPRTDNSTLSVEDSVPPLPTKKHESPPLLSRPFDREIAEIKVRDALFSLGVGLTGEEPGFTIMSEPEALTVEVATQSAARKAMIESALSRLANVRAHISGPEAAKEALMKGTIGLTPGISAEASARRWAQPLLWDYLVAKMGSAQAAAGYSGEILASAGKVRALVAQAHGLSARYPPDVCRSLSDDTHTQVDLLVAKVIVSLAQSSADYVDLLALGFERPVALPHPSPALSWQSRADRLFGLISERDRLLAKLFAVTDPSQDGTVTAEDAFLAFNRLNGQVAELASEATP